MDKGVLPHVQVISTSPGMPPLLSFRKRLQSAPVCLIRTPLSVHCRVDKRERTFHLPKYDMSHDIDA